MVILTEGTNSSRLNWKLKSVHAYVYKILYFTNNKLIVLFFYRKELGNAMIMKENVPNYKDESTKNTDNQSIVVNILFMFNVLSRRLNSVNLHK